MGKSLEAHHRSDENCMILNIYSWYILGSQGDVNNAFENLLLIQTLLNCNETCMVIKGVSVTKTVSNICDGSLQGERNHLIGNT